MKQFKSLMKLLPFVATLFVPNLGWSQTPAAPPALQQKIQALQQAAAQNEQRLHQYQWIETTTLNLNGTPRPPKQSICRYTPYGTVSKTPIGPPQQPPQPSGGPFRQRIEERKIMEAEQELAAVRELTAMYLPLNPGVLKQALQTRRIDFEHEPTGGNALVINDYAKPGDRLTLDLDSVTMQLRRITVRSYFATPSDAYTASVDFSVLGDGTIFPSITTIDAPAKRVTITTVNSSFSRPVQRAVTVN
jgi:hypothetical protein